MEGSGELCSYALNVPYLIVVRTVPFIDCESHMVPQRLFDMQ